MDFKSMEYLVCISEEQNLTSAAKTLYISQPALSYRVSQIESELGVKIIEYSNKSINLTKEGEYLVNWSKTQLSNYNKMKNFIVSISDNESKKIKLGVVNNFARYRLSPIVEAFKNLYPDIGMKLFMGDSSEVLDLLKNNKVDAAITRGVDDWDGEVRVISKEKISVISNEPIDISNLPYMKKISYKVKGRKTRGGQSNKFNENSLNNQIDNWWNENFDIAPNIILEVDDIDTCKAIVKCGAGYSIIPSICLREDDNIYTYDLTLRDGKPIIRNTWLLYKDNIDEDSCVMKFVDFMIGK